LAPPWVTTVSIIATTLATFSSMICCAFVALALDEGRRDQAPPLASAE
jgi:hypothetical protein